MNGDDIAYLKALFKVEKIAYVGFGNEFNPITAIGQRGGEPAASFNGGQYAALTACSLDMFIVYSELEPSND